MTLECESWWTWRYLSIQVINNNYQSATIVASQCCWVEKLHIVKITSADADVRLARRIRRDTVERGREIGAVLDQVVQYSSKNYSNYVKKNELIIFISLLFMKYSKFVKPAFDDFILPTKKYADIIIPRGGDNHVAIDLIVQHIRTKLGQHDLCKIYPNLYVISSTFQVYLTVTHLLLNPIISSTCNCI